VDCNEDSKKRELVDQTDRNRALSANFQAAPPVNGAQAVSALVTAAVHRGAPSYRNR
jgi:hypothetical protein